MAAENDKHATSSPIVSGYEIVRQIGRGGMAKVYLARQTTLNRDVALKELSRFHASTPEMAERFLRESRLVGSLNHPNIVTVYEYFEEDGIPYIAMEYVTGGSLRPYVGHLTLAQLAGVMEGVLAGLAHAQGYGIVHRDLKPENLMVTGDGRVKIADFGIAKATQTVGVGSFLTLTGTTVGTPMYMAPEQALGHEIGAWTDLYSVGVMAWEHVVGEAPFRDTEAAVMILARHVNEQIPLAADLNPDIDPNVSDWIDRLLAKDPAERPSTPEAAWDDLEEVVIARLGPRWRREATLPPPGALADVPRARTAASSELHNAGVSKRPRDSEAAVPKHSASHAEEAQRAVDDSYFTFGRPLERAEPALAVAPLEPVADAMPSIPEKEITDPGVDPDGTDAMPAIVSPVASVPPVPLAAPAPPASVVPAALARVARLARFGGFGGEPGTALGTPFETTAREGGRGRAADSARCGAGCGHTDRCSDRRVLDRAIIRQRAFENNIACPPSLVRPVFSGVASRVDERGRGFRTAPKARQ